MLNIGVGSILTNGLGGPATNLLIFGPFRMYIDPVPVTPTPTPSITGTNVTQTPTPTLTPTPTFTPSGTVSPTPTPIPPSPSATPVIGGGGAGGAGGWYPEEEEEEDTKYRVVFEVKFRGKTVTRDFIVDSFKKDKIIKRVGQINTLRLKFKVAWNKVKNNRFITRWKK